MLAERQRQDDHVGAGGGVVGGGGDRPRGQHLDRERDLRRVAGPGDEHRVAGGHGEPGEHGAHLARTEDPDDGHAATSAALRRRPDLEAELMMTGSSLRCGAGHAATSAPLRAGHDRRSLTIGITLVP
ncbi:hypothetical protein GCM10027610_122310 [Dactylosporangium cerinum]